MQYVKEYGRLLRKYNPLGAARWLLSRLKSHLGKSGRIASFIASLEHRLTRYQQELDFREFDQSHGTDTGRVIPLDKLDVNSKNTADGLWYEGISPRIFNQFMKNIDLTPEPHTFIDFGSGKGRVLLLAAEHGFRNVVGVEFAREIHEIAIKNAEIFNRGKADAVAFEFHLMDAVEYHFPESPLVIFFYCPFRGNVLDRVLANLNISYQHRPRPIHILFYGQNPTVISQFHSMGFSSREISLKRDWTRFLHYRGLIFSSPAASSSITT